MLFRNLFLFRFTPPLAARDAVELQTMLEQEKLQPIGALELSRSGFVAPTSFDDALVHSAGRYALVALGTEQRLLPSGVVEKELKLRCEESENRTGKKPGPRERRSLKDEVITQLLPRAFVQESKLHAYIDFDDGWLVVNTANRKAAESMVTHLRMVLGSFKCTPMAPEASPRGLMTEWVLRKTPSGITLDDSVELREPVDKGAVVRVTHQDLDTDEISEHIKCGKQVFKLSLFYREEMAFSIDDALTVRRLRFLDNVLDEFQDKEFDSAALELAAQFVLMTGEICKLLHWMENTFGIAAVPKMRLDGGDAAPEMKDSTKGKPIQNAKSEAFGKELRAAAEAAGIGASDFRVGGRLTEKLNTLKRLPRSQKKWLTDGERGASSEAIFARMVDVEDPDDVRHPLDPADLRRCLLLLEAVPGFAADFHIVMPNASEVWDKLVDHWTELSKLFEEEAPNWRTDGHWGAPKTYELMKSLGC